MNENLSFEEYLQTKPDSVKDLIITSQRILNTFTKLTYDGKSFEEIISEYSLLDNDTRQDKILFLLKRFSYGVSKTTQRLHTKYEIKLITTTSITSSSFIATAYRTTIPSPTDTFTTFTVLSKQPSAFTISGTSSGVLCSVPISVDWIIESDCSITDAIAATGNVIVQNNAVVTIENGGSLDIDFATKHLLVQSGSKVLIQSGGKIF